MRFKLVEDLDNHKFIYQISFHRKKKRYYLQVFSDDFNYFKSFIYKYTNQSGVQFDSATVNVLQLDVDKQDGSIIFSDTSDATFTLQKDNVLMQIESRVPDRYKRTYKENDCEYKGRKERLINLWARQHRTRGKKYPCNNSFIFVTYN